MRWPFQGQEAMEQGTVQLNKYNSAAVSDVEKDKAVK